VKKDEKVRRSSKRKENVDRVESQEPKLEIDIQLINPRATMKKLPLESPFFSDARLPFNELISARSIIILILDRLLEVNFMR
jgi:hypothetical protein